MDILFSYPLHLIKEDDPKYQNAVERGQIIKLENIGTGGKWIELMNENNFAIIQPCKYFRRVIEFFGDGESYANLYQIPEVSYILRKDLFMRNLHPLSEKIQVNRKFCSIQGQDTFTVLHYFQWQTVVKIGSVQPLVLSKRK